MARTGRPKLEPDVELECEGCGKAIVLPAWKARRSKRHFCSIACYHSRRIGETRRPYKNAARGTKVCPACGTEFEYTNSSEKRNKFCSVACQRAAHAVHGVEANSLTPTEAAYVAGFLDGEGSVMLIKRSTGSVALHLSFANTHHPTLLYLREMIGAGTVNPHRKDGGPNKASWLYRLNHPATASLLAQVAPYMVTKRQQAELALEFVQRLNDPAFRADKKEHAVYHAKMKELNRRGPRWCSPNAPR